MIWVTVIVFNPLQWQKLNNSKTRDLLRCFIAFWVRVSKWPCWNLEKCCLPILERCYGCASCVFAKMMEFQSRHCYRTLVSVPNQSSRRSTSLPKSKLSLSLHVPRGLTTRPKNMALLLSTMCTSCACVKCVEDACVKCVGHYFTALRLYSCFPSPTIHAICLHACLLLLGQPSMATQHGDKACNHASPSSSSSQKPRRPVEWSNVYIDGSTFTSCTSGMSVDPRLAFHCHPPSAPPPQKKKWCSTHYGEPVFAKIDQGWRKTSTMGPSQKFAEAQRNEQN